MSFDFNYKMWVSARQELTALIKKQDVLKRLEPIDNPALAFKIFSELYILYVELVNKLTHCYLHTLQVQKRKVLRTLVDAAVNRLTELKNQLKEIELSEYIYVDKALITRKLQPDDLMIWRSPNFLFRRPPDIQNTFYENKIFMDEESKKIFAEKEKMKLCEAVTLIQAHERARKARIYKATIKYDKSKLVVNDRKIDYKFTHPPEQAMIIPVKHTVYNVNYTKPLAACKNLIKDTEVNLPQEDVQAMMERRDKAARIIQRAWHLYKQKKASNRKLTAQQIILGMKLKPLRSNPNKFEKDVIEMYKLEQEKLRLDEEFVELINDERTRILQEKTPWLMEDISDHIREWFRQFYDATGAFHPYPEAVKTGTVLVLRDETWSLEEFKTKKDEMNMSKADKKKLADKEKQKRLKEKEKLKKEKLKEKEKRKKMKDAGIIDVGYELNTNKHIQNLESTIKQFGIDWRFVDEYLNRNHDPIKDWVTQDELAKVHQELRLLVDEYMRVEYELLQKALAADENRKYKMKKQKRKGKGKRKGKRKKKEPKDITADRTIESLYTELKDAGFIQEKPQHKTFNDYIAEFNFVADETRDENRLTTLGPSVGDIKMVVEESMFGMGEFNVAKPKSMLFIGPFASGKKLLFNIIAAELDALVINISPEYTCKYDEESLMYILHVIMKIAKAFQPTILYFEDVHRLFWKKVPPKVEEELKPRLLQKFINKYILKPIKKEDRIMLIGTSDLPWTAKGKLKRTFQKVILIPRTDYGTAFLMWLEMLEQNAPDHVQDYHVSTLAKVLKKYTTGDVVHDVNETLNLRRKMQLNGKKLQPQEFLEYFIDRPEPQFPLEDKIIEKYNKWYRKSNKYAKLRAKFIKKKLEKKKKK